MKGLYAICFTVFSVAIMFLILAFFQRFRQSGTASYSIRCSLTPTACSWCTTRSRCGCNTGCSTYDLPATVKAPIGFVLTVAFSWALTRALRQIPGATKVL